MQANTCTELHVKKKKGFVIRSNVKQNWKISTKL